MMAIKLDGGWFLDFDGELYGPFATATEAYNFDDQELTDEEVELMRMK